MNSHLSLFVCFHVVGVNRLCEDVANTLGIESASESWCEDKKQALTSFSAPSSMAIWLSVLKRSQTASLLSQISQRSMFSPSGSENSGSADVVIERGFDSSWSSKILRHFSWRNRGELSS